MISNIKKLITENKFVKNFKDMWHLKWENKKSDKPNYR